MPNASSPAATGPPGGSGVPDPPGARPPGLTARPSLGASMEARRWAFPAMLIPTGRPFQLDPGLTGRPARPVAGIDNGFVAAIASGSTRPARTAGSGRRPSSGCPGRRLAAPRIWFDRASTIGGAPGRPINDLAVSHRGMGRTLDSRAVIGHRDRPVASASAASPTARSRRPSQPTVISTSAAARSASRNFGLSY